MSVQQLPAPPKALEYSEAIENVICGRPCGTVSGIVGHRIEVAGLQAPVGALCDVRTSTGVHGAAKVIGFRDDAPILAALDELPGIASGDRVQLVSHAVKVRVGDGLAGRVIDALGRPIDGKLLPSSVRSVPVSTGSPSSLSRPPIDQIFETGIRVVDSMLTCGHGQRVGIFAGSGVGKSTLLAMLARAAKADAIVIGLVGERGREVREFIDKALGEEGMRRSTIVVATSDQPATMRMQAAWTATSVACCMRDAGKNVLLMMDSVTRFALAQRELGLAAGEPPTTRGYPPSVFAELPRLVEQSGRTENGSITAFYSVLVEGDDQNEPISDTIRGLLDGHIVLSRQIASEAQWPAIDVLQSLSRLQNELLDKNDQLAIAKLRRQLALYQTHADLIDIGAYRAGSNPELDQAIALRPMLREFFAQDRDEFSSLATTMQRVRELAAS